MAPDLPSPSGGMKVIYAFVQHLVELGYPASVWHGTPGFEYPGWGFEAPVETGHSLPFEKGDLLVMPETGGGKWSFLSAGQPVVMLCQGIDFVFSDADFDVDVPGDYPGWPQARAAIATSQAIETFLTAACEPGFPIHRVPVEIDDRFQPGTKRRRIALMPRRRREDLLAAVQLVRRSGKLQHWEFVLIDNMTSDQVAQELASSAIFLFGGEREGFGLPGAEAMAAGCYVIGFTGDGAKEYLTPDCAGVIPESDVVEMANQILAAAVLFDDRPTELIERADVGRVRVRERYSPQAVRTALDAAFSEFTAAGFAGQITESVSLDHYQSYAPATDPWNRTRVAVRRQGRRLLDGLAKQRD